MNKLTAIKIKYDDGTYSDEIPVSVLAKNVEWDNTHTLVDVLGSIDVDVTGTIQDQISQLFNEKVSSSAMQDYVTNSMPTYITNWLNTNVNPVGSAVVVDSSLTVSGAAADAKVVGEKLNSPSFFQRWNLYDPNESCKFVARDGVEARRHTTKKNDGSWISYASWRADGQVLYRSLNENKTLPIGTYTLSARITLNPNYSGSQIQCWCKIGLSSDNTPVNMKTERGGDIDIAAETKVGWIKHTVKLSEENPFVFGIEVRDQASSSLPYTVDYIQLETGSNVTEYTTSLWRVTDLKTQEMTELAQEMAELAQEKTGIIILVSGGRLNINKNIISFNRPLLIFSPSEKIYLNQQDIAKMIGAAATYNNETNYINITVPDESSLVYNITNKTVYIVKTTNHSNLDQIILFTPYYGNPSGYLWTKFNIDKIAEGKITDLQANILLSRKGRFEVNTVERTIAFSGLMYIDSAAGERIIITAASVADSLPDNAIYDNETDKVIITLNEEKNLVYSFATSKLAIKDLKELTRQDILLFREYYQNDSGPIWDKYWRDKWIDRQSAGDDFLTATEVFNAEPFTGTYDWQTPVVSYNTLFNGKRNVESFAFFTDPHTLGFSDDDRNEIKMENSFKKIQKVYNSTPCAFMVCGGDWLNNSTTNDEACYRLGYLKGISKNMFKDFYLVLGNHDTNQQGKADSESARGTGGLTNETIAAIMFRDTNTKKAYYSFNGSNSKCYILDTGRGHNTMLPYDWEQIDWLAEQLIADDAGHAIIFMHILTNNDILQTNANNFGILVETYNNHSSITLNNKIYNFSKCSGHVDFWVAGHEHKDSEGTLGNIPYFITATNAYTSDIPVIDLVLVDYDNNTVNLIRVGEKGIDRSFSF